VASTTGKADLVLHEGVVLGHAGADSIAIIGDRISAIGAYHDLKEAVGARTHLIKLGGRCVAPGFIDSHIHFLETAAALSGHSVQRGRTIPDVLADLRLGAGKTPPGNWLRAFGCDEALLAQKRGPTRAELDSAVPKNPLRIRHQTLHASWLNSRAIALLGLEANGFLPPQGATLWRDGTGRLSGLVTGMEHWITSKLPLVTKAESEARARIASRELASHGVTAFTDASSSNGAEQVAAFARFAASGAVVQRAGVMIGVDRIGELQGSIDAAAGAHIRFAGLKFMHRTSNRSVEWARAIRLAQENGIDCAFHATEVEEVEGALADIEAAAAIDGASRRGAVFRIEHGGVITAEQRDRIAAAKVWVVSNPGFIHFRGQKYAAEPGLAAYLYRARSLIESGIEMAAGTDSPVTPPRPLAAIAAAISRATLDGEVLGETEKLHLVAALNLFTVAGARLARLESGAIREGLLADMIVLPENPLRLGASDLMTLHVDITMIGGRVIYERGRPAIASSDSADLRSV
jgi:hypothetical protein